MGRDNILNFAARDGASVYAPCAGYYFSIGAEPRRRCSRLPISSTLAGSYWWFDKFYPSAWMMHFGRRWRDRFRPSQCAPLAKPKGKRVLK
jgi:hypothetical protein